MADCTGTAAQDRYERLTAEQMDEQRIQNVAYQYLCRLEEAKRWMEACLGAELPPPSELEEALRNGVVLARLGHRFAPGAVPLRKIYDPEQLRYQAVGLQFRHTDNINHWRVSMATLGLPAIFYPETTDVYDKKNMPRAVYCIHALSLYLYRLGVAPQIHDLYGKVKFTEEEITTMKLELDKYGIQMPAFSKIGGILTNELSVDEAAVHAAVIAINEALERGQVSAVALALRNPSAQLSGLQEALMDQYQEELRQAKGHKAGTANHRSTAQDKDIYEEYLTQREIQNNINIVNVVGALQQVDSALDVSDPVLLVAALRRPCLSLRAVCPDHGAWYLERLGMERDRRALDGRVEPLDPEDLQEGVALANQDARRDMNMQEAVACVNSALRGRDPAHTLRCLMTSDLQVPEVFPFAAALYHRELQLLQGQSTQGALQQEELFVAVEMLSAVALINQALGAGLLQPFCSSLVSSSAGLSEVDHTLLDRYFECLSGVKQEVGGASLTWNQLQEGINRVNLSAQEAHQKAAAVCVLARAVVSGDAAQLLRALQAPVLALTQVLPGNSARYLALLGRARGRKAQTSRDPGAELWLDEIQEEVTRANQQSQRAKKLCLSLAAVNQAVKENKVSQTLRVLLLPELQLHNVIRECAQQYQQQLHNLITHRMTTDNQSVWVQVRSDTNWFYFHLKRLEGTWERPHNFTHNSVFMDQHDIQDVVSGVCEGFSRSALWRSREALLIRVQAAARGFLLRQNLKDRHRYLVHHTPAVLLIQSQWRRFVQQRIYRRRLQFLYTNWRTVVKVQSLVRMWLTRRKYRARLDFFKQNEGAVIKIQSFFRANRTRADYRTLVHSDTPPLSVVRKFVHLLDLGDGDIREEAELLRVREEVVRSIRFNRQLEADLDLMDLKIGLLVRNRATLQEVVSHCKKLSGKNKEQLSELMDLKRSGGLKALSRESRQRLEGYQHLFYLLQTQPAYLAQLIFLMPHNGSTSFMEMLVFTLFNYGSAQREAYLLLQLFTEALRHEISVKVEQPQDVVTGNPRVIKMLVNFYRHAGGRNVLQEALQPALSDLLTGPPLCVRTDPLDLYKAWVNHTETRTGVKSSLPYEVSPEEALSHPEVQRRLDVSIINLKNLTERVLSAITCSLHLLPYGFRFTAKVLRDALKKKFPHATDDGVYKVVGHLVYYRYMNPAIVAPDGFDVVSRSAGWSLQPEQRLLLGSVARLLQHAAANKVFPGDGAHLRDLNQYIAHTHVRFRRFLVSVCDVPDPDERFSVDEFSELLVLNRPVVHISVSELINMHQLLLEHQEVLCPGPSDPLRQLLQDLGPVPPLQELTGDPDLSCKSEVSLTLTNKFDTFDLDEDQQDVRALLLSTKQLIVDVIRTEPGESLSDILRTTASRDQEVRHERVMQRRAQSDARAHGDAQRLHGDAQRLQSFVNNSRLKLDDKKNKIVRSLRRLEGLGLFTPPHTHNQLLHCIAKDIRQQRLRRQRRGLELLKVRQTLESLQVKSSFHSEQVDYYRHYITSCLQNLTHSKSTNKKVAEIKGKKKLPAVSYSATRLQHKGVLLEIQDLPPSQFKNVMFELVPAAEVGSFRVKTRFLGVEMEEFVMKYQDLLQLQYEGVAVMTMFDKAKINVNLLIFLLNKKFFKKGTK